MGEAKQFKQFEKRVARINDFEPELELESMEELRARTDSLREQARNGAKLDDLLPETFAIVREVGKREMGMRHFDVQMIGGMVLHSGAIAEMKTGEGKTLTATLAVVLNALPGRGVHVVTVNDYLARRDAEWMSPIYHALGLHVGVLQNMQPVDEKHGSYGADVTYGTNSEFGFDYLRDNMAQSLEEKVQRGHPFAIVDEVDNILIDEARTPLIISGQPEAAADYYEKFAKLAKRMVPGKKPEGMDPRLKKDFVADFDFEFEEKHKTVSVTEQGVAKAEKFLGIEHLYRAENGPLVNHLQQALKAESLYKRDVDYAVVDGQVMIIDEFTGRILEGRRWSEGLHQAIEAKEGVHVQEENQTLATITLQNYFRLYDKLAGMTGTALTEATEFMKIYKLPVVEIPTNQAMIRKDQNDQVYKTRDGKWDAVSREIMERHETGQPVLVGTVSVEVSELLSGMLDKHGVKHTVLNAKPEYAEREAEIVAEAGQSGAVTIATNMAGRGVDIKLGGNPEHLTQRELARAGPAAGRPRLRGALPRRAAVDRGARRGRQGEGPRRRRAVHRRHRAPRVAAHRQPAARPRRPPGRSRRVALLPLRRGRPRAPVRRRPDLPHPRPARHDRRGGPRGADRGRHALQADREGAEEGRGAELPAAQARARVRRRHERAAADRLQVPQRDPRGQGHGRPGPRRDRCRHRAHRRRVHARRLHRGLGSRRPVHGAGRHLPDRAHRHRGSLARGDRPRAAHQAASPTAPSRSTTSARPSSATRSCARSSASCCCSSSTRAGASTSTTWTTCARASTCAASPRSSRSWRTRTRRSRCFADLMNTIWADFTRMVFNLEFEAAEGEEPEQRYETSGSSTRPGRVSYSGGSGAAPSALAMAASGGGPVAEELYEDEELPPPVEQRVLSEEQTIGRNDPCWCGSGKKFKKCHGA